MILGEDFFVRSSEELKVGQLVVANDRYLIVVAAGTDNMSGYFVAKKI